MRIIFLVALCGLAACSTSPTLQSASGDVVQTKRSLNRDFTDASLFWLCEDISKYEWLRRFGTPEKARAWKELCLSYTVMP